MTETAELTEGLERENLGYSVAIQGGTFVATAPYIEMEYNVYGGRVLVYLERRTEQELALTLPLMLPSAHYKDGGVRIASFRSSIAHPAYPLSPETPLHATPVSTTWKPRVAAFFLSK
jgi:hypothetical protein